MEAGTLYPLSKGESLLVGVPNGSHKLRGIFIFAKGKGIIVQYSNLMLR